MPTASIRYDERLDHYVFPYEDGAISVAREKCWERDGKVFARIQDRVWQFAGPLPLTGAEEAGKEDEGVEATGSAGATVVSQPAGVEETPPPPEAKAEKPVLQIVSRPAAPKVKRKPGRPRKNAAKG